MSIGQRLMAGGAAAVVLALTVGNYGWLYALVLVGGVVWLAVEKYLSESEREKETLAAAHAVAMAATGNVAGSDSTVAAIRANLP